MQETHEVERQSWRHFGKVRTQFWRHFNSHLQGNGGKAGWTTTRWITQNMQWISRSLIGCIFQGMG